MQDTAEHDRNVESLFRPDRNSSNRVIMDLLRYWESLRAGRIAPARSEIDPRQIKSALRHTFILEFDPIGGIRFRLAGEEISALMGMELRGMPACSVIDISDRQEFEQTLHAMARNPEIVEYLLAGQCNTMTRMLLLPMQDADGNITRILGGLSIRQPLYELPMRFEIIEKMKTRIVAGAGQTSLPSSQGFSEDGQPFLGKSAARTDGPQPESREKAAPAPSDRPYLRLVQNN